MGRRNRSGQRIGLCRDFANSGGKPFQIWITEAQTSGQLPRHLPAELVLYTLFARACDPVLGLLKESGQYSDAQIIDWVTGTTFYGLAGVGTAPSLG